MRYGAILRRGSAASSSPNTTSKSYALSSEANSTSPSSRTGWPCRIASVIASRSARDTAIRTQTRLDPTLVLALLAGATRHIGLGATRSTTYHHPYNVARTFATLDHLSRGRIGWNVVTSVNEGEARNHGPLNVPRSPQGRPVIIQAGASSRGKAFTARWAEVIFAVQPNADAMKR